MSALTAARLRNLAEAVLLVLGMAGVAGLCAWILWGPEGVLWGAVAALLASALSPALPPELVLSAYRARGLSAEAFPEGHRQLAALAARAGLTAAPRLFYVPSSVVNAFSVGGTGDAAIAVSDGLLRTLTPRELTAVLAHEVAHIVAGDLRIMALADLISRLTAWLSYGGLFLLVLNLPLLLMGAAIVPWSVILMLVFAPTLATLLQLALSRAREYEADRRAAALTGDPLGLALALDQLERAERGPWEALFLPGRGHLEPSLLRTHPPTRERIRRLLELLPPEQRPQIASAGGRTSPRRSVPGYRIVTGPPRWRRPGVWY